jgi:hypothetical protein
MSNQLKSDIDSALVYLKVIKKWISEEEQDEHTRANARNWLFKLLTVVEKIAKEIDK